MTVCDSWYFKALTAILHVGQPAVFPCLKFSFILMQIYLQRSQQDCQPIVASPGLMLIMGSIVRNLDSAATAISGDQGSDEAQKINPSNIVCIFNNAEMVWWLDRYGGLYM